MVTLYNVVSADGYIARKDGEEDFIPSELWPSTLEIFSKYDALVMGRKTYEMLQAYEPELLEPFEALSIKKIVVSEDASFQPKEGYIIARTLESAIPLSPNTLVCSGPTLNSALMRAGLVDKIIHQVVPVAIHEGIKPFDADIILPEHSWEASRGTDSQLLTYLVR